ncbi:alpha/beta hydrolase [Paracoccus sp. (in: a-proteobacteria)]|uniref:alpha/beta hydrolase n=1 Tax=Paracoccus sp. TaxID=267 RepID=UPI002AFFD40E|nr:alpha/beta hydrolase [Paracoccus sp. (in: a-proteobacteria)]
MTTISDEITVTVERVSYPARNMGTTIVADLFKPVSAEAVRKYPAIVVTHPFGGVKEQTAGLYARRLAEQGFITLAYDASYQGDSGGEPRLLEVPAQRVDDISCAIDFLVQCTDVDEAGIGSLGVCSGGAYALANAPTEMRVKAVASVSLFDLGDARRNAMGALSLDKRMRRLQQAAEQRSVEARGGAVQLVPVVPDTAEGLTDATPAMYREGQEYYRTERGQHQNSVNRYMVSSLPLQMAFFPFSQIDTIAPRPVLCIAGSKAETAFWSHDVMRLAQQPKELFIVEGASHVDLYDKPEFVGQAVRKLSEFYGEHLAVQEIRG